MITVRVVERSNLERVIDVLQFSKVASSSEVPPNVAPVHLPVL